MVRGKRGRRILPALTPTRGHGCPPPGDSSGCRSPHLRGRAAVSIKSVRQTRCVLADRLPHPSRAGSTSGQAFDADDFVGTFDEWVREQGIRLYPAQEEAVLELVL